MITFRISRAIVWIILGGLSFILLSCKQTIATPIPTDNLQVEKSSPIPTKKTIISEYLKTATQRIPASPISMPTSFAPVTSTPVPTIAPVTSTPIPPIKTPIAIALVSINVRSGPGQQFRIVGNLHENKQIIIIGKAFGLEWWKINCPPEIISSECWITSNERYTSAQFEENVPIVDPPPTPVLTPTKKSEPPEKEEPKDKPKEPPCTGYECPKTSSVSNFETIKDVLNMHIWLMLGMVVGWLLVLYRNHN